MGRVITRDVLLFAGQGSNRYLSDTPRVDGLISRLGEQDKFSFEDFLHSCTRSLQEEFLGLSEEEQAVFGNDTSAFLRTISDPRAFILPPKSFRTHPVTETLALYTRQILELVCYHSHDYGQSVVVETGGLCTGIITAILASAFTSYTSKEFIAAATHGFILSFWIALRAAIFAHQSATNLFPASSWVLGVFGLTSLELEAKLASSKVFETIPEPELRISTILHEDNIFLSGHPLRLEKFKSSLLESSIQCRDAHVHAYYHGGASMEGLLSQVLQDVLRRKIRFPIWESLHVPVRCATTGDRIQQSSANSLLEVALRSIFIDKGNWHNTRNRIFQSLIKSLDNDSGTSFRVIGVGPGSRTLVSAAQGTPSHDRLTVIHNMADFASNTIPEGIAIVGLSVNYPDAHGVEQFWHTLENGLSAVSEVPPSRFAVSQVCNAGHNSQRKLEAKYGNFLKEAFDFDPGFFNISPREAKSMDPQQRLLLKAALDALEDSGYAADSTPTTQRASFGVYVGVATGDYVDNLRDDIDVYYSPGTLRAFLAGRISYAFKFSGPSMVIDTACSSSLVSIYHACRALNNGECTAALAGGVNSITSPDMYKGLSRAHFLSPTGQCKPFDAAADGYCRAEGCGLVVLKRLSQAVEEGDHIYGVIRGTGLNQCGNSQSITHPDSSTQAALFKKVLQSSGISADSINVVEAHGTGTQAGDYAESSSLVSVFGKRSPENPLYVSSVKGNIGHSEAASGLAGLAKLLLMLKNGKIPPQASFINLNPRLEPIKQGHFLIPTQPINWEAVQNGIPRRALLNNFGASGSNAALILEEHIPPPISMRGCKITAKATQTRRSHHILNLSAKSEQALQKLRKDYIEHLQKNPDINTEDLCYSANARKQAYTGFRLSFRGEDTKVLQQQLENGSIPSQKHTSMKDNSQIVFVFSGQGGIYRGMGAELLSTCPVFRHSIERIDKFLSGLQFPTVASFLSGTDPSEHIARDAKVIVEQVACFAIEYALAKLWMSWGVVPSVVSGHSIGEYAALTIAGVLDLNDAVSLVANRAALMASECKGASGMIMCNMRLDDLESLLQQASDFNGLSIACHNSPEDFVVSGPLGPLERFSGHCNLVNVKHRWLPLPYGFHSKSMDPILEKLDHLAAECKLNPHTIKIGSSLLGRLLNPNELIESSYFSRHSRDAVRFSSLLSELESSFAEAHAFVVEIGPTPSVNSMFRKTVKPGLYTFLPSLRPKETAWFTITSSLQTLFLNNYQIRWGQVHQGTKKRFLRNLPRYPLNLSTYVVRHTESTHNEIEDSRRELSSQVPKFQLLSSTSGNHETQGATTTTSMKSLENFITAHVVGNVPLCPASIYMEIAAEARSQMDETNTNGRMLVFEDFVFEKPLVRLSGETAADQPDLTTELQGMPAGTLQLKFSSEGNVHCTGKLSLQSIKEGLEYFTSKEAMVKAHRDMFNSASFSTEETFSATTIYNVMFPRVVEYSEPFLTLKKFTISASGLEGFGTFRMDPISKPDLYVHHPAFLDTLLHAAGFTANSKCATDIACICTSIEKAMVPSGGAEKLYYRDLQVYCIMIDAGHSYVADSYVLNAKDELIGFIEGMSFKKIQLRSFKAHLTRAAESPAPIRRTQLRLSPSRPAPTINTQVSDLLPTPQPSIRDTFRSLISDVCGITCDSTAYNSLEELGVDSLLFIELVDCIRTRFPDMEISKSDLESCNTIDDLLSVITDAADRQVMYQSVSDSTSPPDMTGGNSPASLRSIPSPSTDIEAREGCELETLIEEVCGLSLSENEKQQELCILGVDSLLSIELLAELQERFQLQVDGGSETISSMTFHELQELYSAKTSRSYFQTGTHDAFPKLLQCPLKNEPPRMPMHLFHDGSGMCSMYARISDLRRVVYGHYSPDELPINPMVTKLEDLAAIYIERSNLGSEPEAILAGWSFGGVLAFEVARQLQQRGQRVKGIILIDSPPPVNHDPLPQAVIEHVVGSGKPKLTSEAALRMRGIVEARFRIHASMLSDYHPQSGIDVPCVVLKCMRTMDTKSLCGVVYPWLSNAEFREQATGLWKGLLGNQFTVLELECDHFEVFQPAHANDVSQKLQMACAILEANSSY